LKSDNKSNLEKYYQSCPFPKPKPDKPRKKQNGWKDKPNRRCWYTGQLGAERHEIFGGPNRQTSIDHGFQVDVCREIHERLHANADDWARIENLKWKMYYQHLYEQRLMRLGVDRKEARKLWMTMIGKNYLPQLPE